MKVNLFSIGAMRAGSTSIYQLLNQHPEIYMSKIKEPYYFYAEYWRNRLGTPLSKSEKNEAENVINNGKYRTYNSYQTLFTGSEGCRYIGEGSHYLHHPQTARIIRQYNPFSKIIISLRNPIDRVFSEYLLYLRDGKLDISFNEFVRSRIVWNEKKKRWEPIKLNKGFYSALIPPWIENFGKENVKIVLFEDLKNEPIKFSKSLYSWLEIDTSFQPVPVHAQRSGKPIYLNGISVFNGKKYFLKEYVKKFIPTLLRIKIRDSIYKLFLRQQKMDEASKKILKEIYIEDIEKLEQLISTDLSKWKKIK